MSCPSVGLTIPRWPCLAAMPNVAYVLATGSGIPACSTIATTQASSSRNTGSTGRPPASANSFARSAAPSASGPVRS